MMPGPRALGNAPGRTPPAGPRRSRGRPGLAALPGWGSIDVVLPRSRAAEAVTVSRPLPALVLAAALLAPGVAPAPLGAQGSPLTVEPRVGVAVPVSSFANGRGVGEGTTPGAGFGVEVTLGRGWRAWYAGFSQLRFGCRNAGCPAGEPYVATGVNAGVRIALAPGSRVIPWVGLGALTTRVESPGVALSEAGVSTLGFERVLPLEDLFRGIQCLGGADGAGPARAGLRSGAVQVQ